MRPATIGAQAPAQDHHLAAPRPPVRQVTPPRPPPRRRRCAATSRRPRGLAAARSLVTRQRGAHFGVEVEIEADRRHGRPRPGPRREAVLAAQLARGLSTNSRRSWMRPVLPSQPPWAMSSQTPPSLSRRWASTCPHRRRSAAGPGAAQKAAQGRADRAVADGRGRAARRPAQRGRLGRPRTPGAAGDQPIGRPGLSMASGWPQAPRLKARAPGALHPRSPATGPRPSGETRRARLRRRLQLKVRAVVGQGRLEACGGALPRRPEAPAAACPTGLKNRAAPATGRWPAAGASAAAGRAGRTVLDGPQVEQQLQAGLWRAAHVAAVGPDGASRRPPASSRRARPDARRPCLPRRAPPPEPRPTARPRAARRGSSRAESAPAAPSPGASSALWASSPRRPSPPRACQVEHAPLQYIPIPGEAVPAPKPAARPASAAGPPHRRARRPSGRPASRSGEAPRRSAGLGWRWSRGRRPRPG